MNQVIVAKGATDKRWQNREASLIAMPKDQWATPEDVFAPLDAEFGFTLDACATAENRKCERYWSPQDDGLAKPWDGVVWCNPPYGAEIARWVQKARESADAGATVVLLLPVSTSTRWFHDLILGRAEIRFVRGRIRFVGAEFTAPFSSMIVVFRPEAHRDG